MPMDPYGVHIVAGVAVGALPSGGKRSGSRAAKWAPAPESYEARGNNELRPACDANVPVRGVDGRECGGCGVIDGWQARGRGRQSRPAPASCVARGDNELRRTMPKDPYGTGGGRGVTERREAVGLGRQNGPAPDSGVARGDNERWWRTSMDPHEAQVAVDAKSGDRVLANYKRTTIQASACQAGSTLTIRKTLSRHMLVVGHARRDVPEDYLTGVLSLVDTSFAFRGESREMRAQMWGGREGGRREEEACACPKIPGNHCQTRRTRQPKRRPRGLTATVSAKSWLRPSTLALSSLLSNGIPFRMICETWPPCIARREIKEAKRSTPTFPTETMFRFGHVTDKTRRRSVRKVSAWSIAFSAFSAPESNSNNTKDGALRNTRVMKPHSSICPSNTKTLTGASSDPLRTNASKSGRSEVRELAWQRGRVRRMYRDQKPGLGRADIPVPETADGAAVADIPRSERTSFQVIWRKRKWPGSRSTVIAQDQNLQSGEAVVTTRSKKRALEAQRRDWEYIGTPRQNPRRKWEPDRLAAKDDIETVKTWEFCRLEDAPKILERFFGAENNREDADTMEVKLEFSCIFLRVGWSQRIKCIG
ncbi:hypothetical protein C8R46DRAFT_1036204 [Mycena filopes]|nr:hypothetical protein C8R46DRAFT_1036204 [Mycena filopes]